MPGPGKKPANLKVVAGTDRKDRAPESTVEMPNVHARKEWNRLAPILVANKLLTEAGLSAFGMLCSLHGKLVQLWSAGEAPVASMVSQYRNLVNDFGLTPVSQGKVKQVGEPTAENKFSRNGKRAA